MTTRKAVASCTWNHRKQWALAMKYFLEYPAGQHAHESHNHDQYSIMHFPLSEKVKNDQQISGDQKSPRTKKGNNQGNAGIWR